MLSFLSPKNLGKLALRIDWGWTAADVSSDALLWCNVPQSEPIVLHPPVPPARLWARAPLKAEFGCQETVDSAAMDEPRFALKQDKHNTAHGDRGEPTDLTQTWGGRGTESGRRLGKRAGFYMSNGVWDWIGGGAGCMLSLLWQHKLKQSRVLPSEKL